MTYPAATSSPARIARPKLCVAPTAMAAVSAGIASEIRNASKTSPASRSRGCFFSSHDKAVTTVASARSICKAVYIRVFSSVQAGEQDEQRADDQGSGGEGPGGEV